MKSPLKNFLLSLVLGAFVTTGFIACGDSDSGTDSGNNVPRDSDTPYYNSDTPSDKPSTQALDFFTAPCAQMGGKLNANGACIIPCETDNDCAQIKGASKCSKGSTWRIAGYCEPESCDQEGWFMGTSVCQLSCSVHGDRTENCLAGTECSVIPGREGFCSGNVSLSSSSTVTSSPSTGGGSGVCSGCGGLFCSGRCVGCPGC